MREKHVPLRSCVVCRTKVAKRELIRIVHTPTGDLVVDNTGKQSGRGAYLCSNPDCWHRAFVGGRLSHALRAEMSPEDKGRLAEAVGAAR
jgi:predicted RNA-binding protein YlxR (DUF448 family)